MRRPENPLSPARGGRVSVAIAAVVLLCAGLLPQTAYAATPEPAAPAVETAHPTPSPEAAPGDGSEPTASPAPVATDAAEEPDRAPEPAPEESAAPPVPEPTVDAAESLYPTPLDGDYAGDVVPDLADPTAAPQMRSLLQQNLATESPQDVQIMTLAGFRPGNIISNARLYTSGTLTVAGIQSFLNGKVTSCESGYTCLKDFRQTTNTRAANTYCTSSYSGAVNETAAQIIAKVARACNVSEKVLLVMLQKEQGLVTLRAPSKTRYDRAMGYGCPDTGPGGSANCDPAYYGFHYQMYMAAYQLQRYTKDSYFNWFPVGKSSRVQWHPNGSCGSAPVFIENEATAALYYYTPYQPNAAALSAGYGTGDRCSSYGNRNFYNYYTDWFGSTGSSNLCEVPANVTSAKLQYVTLGNVNARKAPTTGCGDDLFSLAPGTVLQALRATADQEWIEVQTLRGPRWVFRELVRVASPEQAACALPTGTSSAHRQYVVRSATAARTAPSESCTIGAGSLAAGSVLQATRVSAGGDWLEVTTADGARWVERADLDYAAAEDIAAACTDPAGTRAASRQYVVISATPERLSPVQRCGVAPRSFAAGAVVQATRISASGLWLEVLTQAGPRWLARDAVAYADDADVASACVDPSGTSRNAGRFLARESTLGWVSPLVACGTGSRSIGAGTVLQATRQSASGKWLEIRTGVGERWIPRDAVVMCADPARTSKASKNYIVRETVSAIVSPLADCGSAAQNWGAGTAPKPVAVGTVLQATRLSASGQWLEVKTALGERWVARGSVEMCADPAGTRKASKQYVTLGRTEALISPLAECGTAPKFSGAGTGPLRVPGGTVFEATRVSASGKWLEVRTQAGPRWVSRSDVEYAASDDVAQACAEPAGTRTASLRYVARESTRGWTSPLLTCGTGSTGIAAGAVLQASRVSASGDWLEVRTQAGPRWVARAAVGAATSADVAAACVDPAGTRPASGRYVTTRTTTGWVSPLAACATGGRTLDAGTVVQATRMSSSGTWIEVETSAGRRWVLRADVASR